MKRALIVLVVTIGALALAAPVLASDASLERALQGYKSRLTSDIGYLASFSAPSRSGASSALRRLSSIDGDLSGAIRAADGQRASTSNGSRGKSLLLSALSDAEYAAGYGRASAYSARAGNGSAARSDVRSEQRYINRAIPLFEQGGRLLHLF